MLQLAPATDRLVLSALWAEGWWMSVSGSLVCSTPTLAEVMGCGGSGRLRCLSAHWEAEPGAGPGSQVDPNHMVVIFP